MAGVALERLRGEDGLGELDVHFARFIARLDGGRRPLVALAAALLSRASGFGHVCLELPALAGRPVLEGLEDAPQAPPPAAWRAELEASPAVGAPGEARPLVLDRAGRLYLHRYWEYEQEVATELTRRAAVEVAGVDEAVLVADLGRLFPGAEGQGEDRQKTAAAVAVLRALAVISGGPGTGKTTTVVRVLAALLAQPGGQRLRIALAAPTGKAANRMQEALRAAREHLPVDESVRAAVPAEASTLHRLLGTRPGSVYFRHDRRRPLPVDVLVVDEASMIDLALMAKLLCALSPAARLVLLGDKDQLASVEAGAVLGDLCAGARGFGSAFAARVARITGARPVEVGGAPPLADSVVLLDRSYRFGAASGIGRLARAINAGDADAAVALLAEGAPDLGWVPQGVEAHLAARLAAGYRAWLEAVRSGAGASEVFARFNRFRVLCAHRAGPAGAATVNRMVLEALEAGGLAGGPSHWFPGRPVMVTQNSYELRLFNGDIGIAMRDPEAGGALRVFFEGPQGGLRRLAPARLPAHEPAFALTVHKAQGSEFDEVLLLLPPAPSPVLTRELLYTAVTRARSRVVLHGTEAVLRAGIGRRAARSSGLRERLWPG